MRVNRFVVMAVVAVLLGGVLATLSRAQQVPSGDVPPVQPQASNFDAEAATEAYLARLTPEQRTRSGRLLRGRVLAHLVELRLRRCGRAATARDQAVGEDA